MVLGGIILFIEPDAVPFFGKLVPRWGMYAIGAAAVGWWWPAYVGLSRFVGTIRLFGAEIELPGWRMAFVQVALATVDVAVTAAIFYQLLPRGAGPDLRALPRRLCRLLHRRAGGQPAGRPRRVRHRDAAGARALSAAAADPGRDRRVPAVLLHHPAVPGRHAVRRQRDPAARRRAAAQPGARRGGRRRSSRWSEPGFAVVAVDRRGRAVRRAAAGASACWTSGRTSPGSTRTSPTSRPMPGSSCRR